MNSMNSILQAMGKTSSATQFAGSVSEGFEFKRATPLDQRRAVAQRIRDKYPDRVPVIVERATTGAGNVPKAEKSKYLVNCETTVAAMLLEIRRQIKLSSDQALFFFVGNGVLPPTAALLSQIYDRFHDDDGFLYMAYASENTFGASMAPAL